MLTTRKRYTENFGGSKQNSRQRVKRLPKLQFRRKPADATDSASGVVMGSGSAGKPPRTLKQQRDAAAAKKAGEKELILQLRRDVADRFRIAREAANLDSRQFAAQMGETVQTVESWEGFGKVGPVTPGNPNRWAEVRAVLGVGPDFLLLGLTAGLSAAKRDAIMRKAQELGVAHLVR